MDINIIRFVDRKLGDLMISLSPTIRKSGKKSLKSPSTILVIKIWGIGSLVNLSPSINQIKKIYPHAKIDLLTSTQNTTLYSHLFSKIYSFDMSKKIGLFYDMLKTALILRKNKYDLLIDFEPLARSTAIFSRIISPKQSIGFDLAGGKRKKMFTDYVLYNQENKHISSIFYELLPGKAKSKEKIRLLEPSITKKETQAIEEFLSKNKIKKYICINMNASELALQRRWAPKKFSELSRLMLQEFQDCHQLYVGGPNDKDYIHSNIGGIENEKIINVAGKFSILETAFLFKKSNLLISNDSGPLHLAAAVGCPSISFFGPETPKLYAPLSDKARIFYKNLPCSPCINIKNAKKIHCEDPICLDFSVKEVFEAVKGMLA